MTAVLQATDALRSRGMSLDDTEISYSSSSTDWRAKYNEVADMLAETRAELDDFHHASKELETELENELARTEKTQQDLKVKVARAESEKDEWKSKFMSLQTTHNSTTTSLQRELDKLRQEHQHVKVQLRELEMGNDDLERTERAVSSSLADIEAKYSRALEEKIILEHELLDKANLEEQCQRLKDELRDANIEVSILKDQLDAKAKERLNPATVSSVFPEMAIPSCEDLLNTPPPPDLSLSELDPSSESLPDSLLSDDDATPKKRASVRQGQSALLHHAGFQPNKPGVLTPPSTNGIPRSSTLPSMYSSPRHTTRQPVARPTPTNRNPSSMSTTSNSSTTSKNKGVQMVSEMRARVRNLEQKIHTRVPRLRMGSITAKTPSNSVTTPAHVNGSTASTSSPFGRSIVGKTSWENPLTTRRSADSQRRASGTVEKGLKDAGSDSSGWVLIMEDSSSPPRNRDKERRRASSPLGGSTFRPAASTSTAGSTSQTSGSRPNPLYQSTANTGLRRPGSRLSAGSTVTTSSIPTPTSRPSTPTFLPVPSSGLTSLKRSTGPAGGNLAKRSSLGSSSNMMPPPDFLRERNSRPGSSTSSTSSESKTLPQIPGLANVNVRAPSKLPPSASASILAQSRIGRPSGGRRKSSEDPDGLRSDLKGFDLRPRSGSSASNEHS